MIIWNGTDIIGMVLALVILMVMLFIFTFKKIKQAICRHKDTYHNRVTLDEFCRKCGKNLGFVGRNKC